MGRLMSIDFGRRRCGIAATDTLRIVANGVATVETGRLIEFVKQYVVAESVDAVIVGFPTTMRVCEVSHARNKPAQKRDCPD